MMRVHFLIESADLLPSEIIAAVGPSPDAINSKGEGINSATTRTWEFNKVRYRIGETSDMEALDRMLNAFVDLLPASFDGLSASRYFDLYIEAGVKGDFRLTNATNREAAQPRHPNFDRYNKILASDFVSLS